jgi:hypothetical protein
MEALDAQWLSRGKQFCCCGKEMGHARCGRGKGKVGKNQGQELDGKNGGRGATKCQVGGCLDHSQAKGEQAGKREILKEKKYGQSLLFTGMLARRVPTYLGGI